MIVVIQSCDNRSYSVVDFYLATIPCYEIKPESLRALLLLPIFLQFGLRHLGILPSYVSSVFDVYSDGSIAGLDWLASPSRMELDSYTQWHINVGS